MPQASEVILSGSGGQGLIMAGQILAEAAIKDGKNVVQTQSYGPEARGGASKAEIIISESEIDYPKVTRPGIILVMSHQALSKYAGELKPGGALIVDTTYIKDLPPAAPAKVLALPCSRIAKESFNKEIVANIVALGALAAFTGIVSKESLYSALILRIPPGTEDLNKKALELGWESARQAAA